MQAQQRGHDGIEGTGTWFERAFFDHPYPTAAVIIITVLVLVVLLGTAA